MKNGAGVDIENAVDGFIFEVKAVDAAKEQRKCLVFVGCFGMDGARIIDQKITLADGKAVGIRVESA